MYSRLPIIRIKSKQVLKKLHQKPLFFKALVDIFDDDIYSSKISFWVNGFMFLMIVLSSIEVMLATDNQFKEFNTIFDFIYIFTSIIFTIEIFLRLYVVGYIEDKYQGFLGKIRYLFSFYGLIDLISLLPFYLELLGFNQYKILKILRTFRLWRSIRYVKSVDDLIQAVISKANDIVITLLIVVLLAIPVSGFIYYFENQGGQKQFESILSAFLWSIGKYTGDYGGIADFTPQTSMGKLLATINGILGIAIFAVPAGILGSAFIDTLNQRNHQQNIQKNIQKIDKFFYDTYTSKKHLNKNFAYGRHFTFFAITSKTDLTEQEIVESVRETSDYLLRPHKSSENAIINDMLVVEKTFANKNYGAYYRYPDCNLWFINPMGAVEKGVNHFVYTLFNNTPSNYVARTKRFYNAKNQLIKNNFSEYFEWYGIPSEYQKLPPSPLFDDYMEDMIEGDYVSGLPGIQKNDYVFVFCSAGSGRGAEVNIEYGNKKDTTENQWEHSTIHNPDKFLQWKHELLSLQGTEIFTQNKGKSAFQFDIKEHVIGNYDQKWIGKALHRLTGANVVTVYVNINILSGEDQRYYALLNYMLQAFQKVWGKREIVIENNENE